MTNNILIKVGNMFKNNTNIKKNYLEYISALLYLKFYKENITSIIIQNDQYLPDILDDKIKKLQLSLNNYYLFSNITFKNIFNNNKILSNILKDIDTIYNKKKAKELYQNALDETIKEDNIIRNQNEYYTPPSITNLLSNLIDHKYSNVFDPFCGTGNFLLSANKPATFGIETNLSIYNICMTNLFLNNIDNYNIKLTSPLLNNYQFDLILSNPPFSQKNWYNNLEDETKSFISQFHLPSTAVADYAHVLKMFKALSPDGKMAVILPHGALFRQNEIGVRTKLVKENFIEAIIGLPPKLFYNNKLAVIVLIMSKNKQSDKILFIDASKEYKKNKKNNELTIDNQNKIITTYKESQEIPFYSHLATISEIASNNFDLSLKKYITEKQEEKNYINKTKLQENITKLEIEKNIIAENTQNILENIDNSIPKKPQKLSQVVGINIKYYREEKKISQKELADYLNINKTYLSLIENGHTNISLEYLDYICQKLNIDIIDLFKSQ